MPGSRRVRAVSIVLSPTLAAQRTKCLRGSGPRSGRKRHQAGVEQRQSRAKPGLNPQTGEWEDSDGTPHGAIDDLSEAIHDFPDDHSDDDTGKADAYANRGLARHRAGDLGGAMADYAEALKRNVSPGFVHYNAACTYSLLGDAGEACRWLAEAIDHNPVLREDAREDPDFYPMHRESCFQALIWG